MKRFLYFIPGITWWLICTVLLVIPGNELPSTNIKIPFFDKIVHLGMFALMTFLFSYPYIKVSKTAAEVKAYILAIALYALAFGIAMEFVQKYLVANRSFDEVDILFDALGCATGAWFSWVVYKKIGPDRNRGRNQN
ncbi:VanZ family protein [Aridibaculum aurantiacum]|uniref:VanZ family protein n=1 Tax=Aridibaculum aurantiacum TaxID=2810307 RepID=UPI001A962E5F|nr:VanZ family protein [Aridibaculum aurantiacum]